MGGFAIEIAQPEQEEQADEERVAVEPAEEKAQIVELFIHNEA
jgi:hypothetical protein